MLLRSATQPSKDYAVDYKSLEQLFKRWGDEALSSPHAARESASAEQAVAQLSGTAVSIAFLNDFYTSCVELIPGGSEMTTKEVVELIIKPAMKLQPRFSWADRLPRAVGKPVAVRTEVVPVAVRFGADRSRCPAFTVRLARVRKSFQPARSQSNSAFSGRRGF